MGVKLRRFGEGVFLGEGEKFRRRDGFDLDFMWGWVGMMSCGV